MRNLVILGGSSHPTLTKSICNRLGVPEGNIVLGKFSNGETSIQIQESVRGKDVFIITTGCGEINEILMELFIMLSACKTASAKSTFPRRHTVSFDYTLLIAIFVGGFLCSLCGLAVVFPFSKICLGALPLFVFDNFYLLSVPPYFLHPIP